MEVIKDKHFIQFFRWFILTPIVLISLLFFQCESSVDSRQASINDHPWGFSNFEKVDSLNPILKPDPDLTFIDPLYEKPVKWAERNVLNPAAIKVGDTTYLFFRAQDSLGTSRVGLATSTDGLHFQVESNPVLYPAADDMNKFEWNFYKRENKDINPQDCKSCYFDGVEDPRIVRGPGGLFYLTYTAYDGKTARLSLAVSGDLRNWQKKGLILKDDRFADYWSKSGAIITKMLEKGQTAAKLGGKYWMYFGDTDLFMASSDDLIDWRPLLNEENGELISVLHPRPGFFDSRLVEPGPYALVTEEGIVLIYNASNAANFNDPALPKFTYAAGQALYDRTAPYRLISRKDSHFISPDKEYEIMGEVNWVCFVEGLTLQDKAWHLYYGTADSRIAVAVGK